jgi:hypothetical protein
MLPHIDPPRRSEFVPSRRVPGYLYVLDTVVVASERDTTVCGRPKSSALDARAQAQAPVCRRRCKVVGRLSDKIFAARRVPWFGRSRATGSEN